MEEDDRRYSVMVDRGAPTECDEATLMMEWLRVPDLALRVRSLATGEETTLFETPKVVVRRLQ